MPDAPLKPELIQGLLAYLLVGTAGGSEMKWRKLIGEVELLTIATNVHSAWRVTPKGTAGERDAILKAVTVVRKEHPYVS